MADLPTDRPDLAALLPVTTRSPEDTLAWGARLAAVLRPGDVVALYGDLGAGKTHLAKGIGAALGVPAAAVNSPTFTIVHEYDADALTLYHFDAYRLAGTDAFYELGYEDYFYSDGICLVEWPSRIEALLPAETIRLRLSHVDETTREIAWADHAG